VPRNESSQGGKEGASSPSRKRSNALRVRGKRVSAAWRKEGVKISISRSKKPHPSGCRSALNREKGDKAGKKKSSPARHCVKEKGLAAEAKRNPIPSAHVEGLQEKKLSHSMVSSKKEKKEGSRLPAKEEDLPRATASRIRKSRGQPTKEKPVTELGYAAQEGGGVHGREKKISCCQNEGIRSGEVQLEKGRRRRWRRAAKEGMVKPMDVPIAINHDESV